MMSCISAANEILSPMSPGKKSLTNENSRKQCTDAEALTVMLREKNRQIQLLREQLKLSDEYGRNLGDLLRELVRLLKIIEA